MQTDAPRLQGPLGRTGCRLHRVEPPSPAPEGHHTLPPHPCLPLRLAWSWSQAEARVPKPKPPPSGDQKVLNKWECQIPAAGSAAGSGQMTLSRSGAGSLVPLHSSMEVWVLLPKEIQTAVGRPWRGSAGRFPQDHSPPTHSQPLRTVDHHRAKQERDWGLKKYSIRSKKTRAIPRG